MTGRRMMVRERKRGEYEIIAGGRIVCLFELYGDVDRRSTAARAMTAALAAHQHDEYVDDLAPTDGIDWTGLGWQNRKDHDDWVDDLRRRQRALPDRAQAWVRTNRQAAGIPAHGPYSLDQIETIDSLLNRALPVLEQDLAAEGTAA